MISKGYQGIIQIVRNKNGRLDYVHAYRDSSDYPGMHMVQLIYKDEEGATVERVPLNKEIWRDIGIALGYTRKRAKK